MESEMPDELVTIQDAARRLGVPAIDVRRLLQDKKLPAIQIESGQWRISAKALQEYAKGAKMAQAAYFMSKRNVSKEKLITAGAACVNGIWTFPDGSEGRLMPFEGRLIALEDSEESAPPERK
jgi:excisionase family DNA binding protein